MHNKLLAALLVVLNLAIFLQTRNFEFMGLDDELYVTGNDQVKAGLTLEGIRYAFSMEPAPIVNPLALLTHMLDVDLFGVNPGPHHLTNVFLHTLNTLLLFAFILKTTKRSWPAFFVAAFFAAHPLHVESVAWISDRKDVLSATFWLLALLAYARYVDQPKWTRMGTVTVFFILSLLAKPMAVTLPFLLLLLDLWPFRRVEATWPSIRSNLSLVWEKVSMIAITAFAAYATWLLQDIGGAVRSTSAYSVTLRFGNAAAGYGAYLIQTVWPINLGLFYPLDRTAVYLPGAVFGAIMLVAGTLCAIALRRSRPWFFVGWFWYVGLLVPVIGLVQVGDQAHADRYTYLPIIGLFLILVWAVEEACAKAGNRRLTRAAVAAGLCCVVVLAGLAHRQTRLWRDTPTLFKHTIAVCGPSGVMYNNLGLYYKVAGDIPRAREYFNRVFETNPESHLPHYNLGVIENQEGQFAKAVPYLEEAVSITPNLFDAHLALAWALVETERPNDAIRHAQVGAASTSKGFLAYAYTGLALEQLGRRDEALAMLEDGVRAAPGNGYIRLKAAEVLERAGRFDEALQQFEMAAKLDPDNPSASRGLARVRAKLNAPAESESPIPPDDSG